MLSQNELQVQYLVLILIPDTITRKKWDFCLNCCVRNVLVLASALDEKEYYREGVSTSIFRLMLSYNIGLSMGV
jgi:hypothetical protein